MDALVGIEGRVEMNTGSAQVAHSASSDDTDEALELLTGRALVLLTGAGLSTDSGIPDYRGPGSVNRSPMTYQEFISGPEAQRRYWARSYLGWATMGKAQPNAGHRAVAAIDPVLLITQNVDGLHEAAGSARIVPLHGRIAEVVCLGCGTVSDRAGFQEVLARANSGFAEERAGRQVLPDGDAALEDTSGFVVPPCERCGGALKPHVVFFGENVPKERVARCYAAVEELADVQGALLVAGSSLTVMSGLRFVRRAAEWQVPIVIVNRGETRGDPLATRKLETGCSEFLSALAIRADAQRA